MIGATVEDDLEPCPVCGYDGVHQPDSNGVLIHHPRRYFPCRAPHIPAEPNLSVLAA